MAINLNDNINTISNKPLDNRYSVNMLGATGYYETVAAANLAIPIPQRHRGLTVGIKLTGGLFEEYWYRDGVADINLIPKGSGSAGAENGLNVYTNNKVRLGGDLLTNTTINISDGSTYSHSLFFQGAKLNVHTIQAASTNPVDGAVVSYFSKSNLAADPFMRSSTNPYAFEVFCGPNDNWGNPDNNSPWWAPVKLTVQNSGGDSYPLIRLEAMAEFKAAGESQDHVKFDVTRQGIDIQSSNVNMHGFGEAKYVSETLGDHKLTNGVSYQVITTGGNYSNIPKLGAVGQYLPASPPVGTILHPGNYSDQPGTQYSPATWGAGGKVMVINNYTRSTLFSNDSFSTTEFSKFFFYNTQVSTPTYGVNDTTYLQVGNNRYTEWQLTSQTKRNNTAYIPDNTFVLVSGGTTTPGGGTATDKTFTSLGVGRPTTNDIGNPAPKENQYTAYSTWGNNGIRDGVSSSPTSNNDGWIEHTSQYTYFTGLNPISPKINDQEHRVGINMFGTTIKRPLEIQSYTNTKASLRLVTAYTPASSSAVGLPGDISWDGNYIYVCVAGNGISTGTWKRAALSTW
jgi:hypothetical protein